MGFYSRQQILIHTVMPQGITTDQGRMTRGLGKGRQKWGGGRGGTKLGDGKMTRFFDWE